MIEEKIVKKIVKCSRRKHSERGKIVALIGGGLLFGVVIPFSLLTLSNFLDDWLGLPKFIVMPLNFLFALPLIVFGLSFAIWAVWMQIALGKGTPAPIIPTQRLITEGPYSYCRNPMVFGIVAYYLGISILIGSFSSIGLTALFLILSSAYLKIIEEKELEERFGERYLEYKKNAPFLLPKIRWKQNSVKGEVRSL